MKRSLPIRRRLALMDERSAIAGELHDSLAQALSYMKLQGLEMQFFLCHYRSFFY